MSTEDNTIRIMNMGGMFIIGDGALNVLKSPRIIGRQQDGSNAFLEMIGRPKEIVIPTGAFVWAAEDAELVSGYRQSVTGLVMATAIPAGNVVGMRRQ